MLRERPITHIKTSSDAVFKRLNMNADWKAGSKFHNGEVRDKKLFEQNLWFISESSTLK